MAPLSRHRGRKWKLLAAVVPLLAVVALLWLLVGSEGAVRSTDETGRASGPVDSPARPGAAPVAGAPAREPAPAPGQGTEAFDEVFFAPWGAGPGELGRREADESAPEGPMSFVVDAWGRVLVLDQVNERIQIFEEGRTPRSIPLPADSYQDIGVDRDGNPVLLDRLVRRSVETLGPGGTTLTAPLEGGGIPEGGGTTAMFVRDDGVWVEVEHGRLVRVADAAGRPDPERPAVPGRFSADGRWLLSAAREGHQAAVVLARPATEPETSPRLFAHVRFGLPVLYLRALESDPAGRVLLAAHLARFRPTRPFDVIEQRLEIVLLAPDGHEADRLRLPVSRGALDRFRSLFVGPDGLLYHFYFDETGASLRRLAL